MKLGDERRAIRFWSRAFARMPAAAALAVGAILIPQLAQAHAAGQWRDARQMFESTCAYCHGAGVASELRGRELPRALIVFAITNGFQSMPAFRPTDFSVEDIAALVDFITTSPAPAVAPAAAGAPAPSAAPAAGEER